MEEDPALERSSGVEYLRVGSSAAEPQQKTKIPDPTGSTEDLLCGGAFSRSDLEAAVRVMTALGKNETEYSSSPAYKPFRGALAGLLRHEFSLKLQAKSDVGEKNAKAAERRRAETRRRAQERNLIDSRGLRASRIAQLKQLMESQPEG